MEDLTTTAPISNTAPVLPFTETSTFYTLRSVVYIAIPILLIVLSKNKKVKVTGVAMLVLLIYAMSKF